MNYIILNKKKFIEKIHQNLQNYWSLIQEYPEVVNDKELFEAALNSKKKFNVPLLKYAGDEVLKDERLVLMAIEQNATNVHYINFDFIENLTLFFTKALETNPKCSRYIFKEKNLSKFRNEVSETKSILRNKGLQSLTSAIIYYASFENDARIDYEFMKKLIMMANDPNNMPFISDCYFKISLASASDKVRTQIMFDEELCRYLIESDCRKAFDFDRGLSNKILNEMGLEIQTVEFDENDGLDTFLKLGEYGKLISVYDLKAIPHRLWSYAVRFHTYNLYDIAKIVSTDDSSIIKNIKLKDILKTNEFILPIQEQVEVNDTPSLENYVDELRTIALGNYDVQTRRYLVDELESRYEMFQEKVSVDKEQEKKLSLVKKNNN